MLHIEHAGWCVKYDKFVALPGCDVDPMHGCFWPFPRRRCSLRQEKYVLYFCHFWTEEGRSLTSLSVHHELLDSPLSIWFVVTERDFSLLCYGTSWWVMKGFILEATLRHTYLPRSLPLSQCAGLLFLSCRGMPGRKKAAASLSVPEQRHNQGCYSMLLFWVHLASYNLNVHVNFFTWERKERS